MGTTGEPGRRRTRDTYRRVIGLTGPLLPCVSFLGRLPTATIQFGSVLLVARTSGSLGAAGLTGGALALGQVACGPLVGRLADRHGQRPVVLAFSLANALAVAALVTGALAGLPTPVLALQGAVFGACQAGVTALTARLGQEDQAGLVYAAMGVMSAVAGLAMAAVPERVGARTRWRLATGAGCALSLPLPGTSGLPGLYAVVTVLGLAYAPHLITVFGMVERAVAPSRLAEAMGVATSALVGGQALAVAVTGRLAEAHGPCAAFTAASTAAGLAFVLALTVRPTTYAGEPGKALHARVRDAQPR